jgi:RNA polymerase sigma factor (sigma-70 family)
LTRPDTERITNSTFHEIVESWQDMVYNTALGIVQNSEDAQDITQDVFLKVFEKLSDFRSESMLSTWIYRITVRKALDQEKKKLRQRHGGFLKRVFSIAPGEEPVVFDHPGVQLDRKEKASILFRSLKKIPEKQRVAFTLQKLEGMTAAQVADIMEMSVQAVESLLARAKANLQEILKEYYKHNEAGY